MECQEISLCDQTEANFMQLLYLNFFFFCKGSAIQPLRDPPRLNQRPQLIVRGKVIKTIKNTNRRKIKREKRKTQQNPNPRQPTCPQYARLREIAPVPHPAHAPAIVHSRIAMQRIWKFNSQCRKQIVFLLRKRLLAKQTIQVLQSIETFFLIDNSSLLKSLKQQI